MSYLSPEAARGDEVDNRADIFSVGILLYELLTGKRLFYGETDYQTVELVRNAKVPPIKAQNPEVEQELEVTVRKALAKRKEDRYQTATDLQDALAQYSYSRALKVISRDIADLIRQCLEDNAAESGGKRRAGNILDTLLQDEINKFTSVDFEDPGARPLAPGELSGGQAGGDFVDPRGWAIETSSQPHAPGHRPTGSVPLGDLFAISGDEGRPTLRDANPTGLQAFGSARNERARGSQPGGSDAFGGPTPGPEALASVLEPMPETVPGKSGARKWSSRAMVIAMIAGLVVLAAAVTASVAMKRRSVLRSAGAAGQLQRP
jgi:serine/threonine-protein kinase